MDRLTVLRTFSTVKSKFNLDVNLKDEQVDIITALLNKEDVFAVLPTGFGKSLCYILPPLLLQQITTQFKTALIISPLKALMLQQVNHLQQNGVSANAICEGGLDETSIKDIKEGRTQILFASPESILKRKWLDVIKRKYSQQICVQAFDEVHCVSEWGLDFRPDYRNIREFCSLLEVPTLALTATASSAIQKDVYDVLCLGVTSPIKVVAKLTNTFTQSQKIYKDIFAKRPNVFLHFVNSKENFTEELKWLLDHLLSSGINTPKTIVYCSTIQRCQIDFNSVLERFGQKCYDGEVKVANRLIEMYHSGTADETKTRILKEFASPSSKIRVLMATVAFGMGIDIPDIRIIVNWGLPRSVLQFWQESGRCARDMKGGLSVCYAYP